MNGRINLKIGGKYAQLWFNNYSKSELAKLILPKDGNFPPKPEEFPFLNALSRLADENYLSLMKDVLWSGLIGFYFAESLINPFDKKEISLFVATCDEKSLYDVWICFLESMGVNVDGINEKMNQNIDESKKKS